MILALATWSLLLCGSSQITSMNYNLIFIRALERSNKFHSMHKSIPPYLGYVLKLAQGHTLKITITNSANPTLNLLHNHIKEVVINTKGREVSEAVDTVVYDESVFR